RIERSTVLSMLTQTAHCTCCRHRPITPRTSLEQVRARKQ
ncbi:hypothetical protein CSUI_005885, partial [Cystoisospora suis]